MSVSARIYVYVFQEEKEEASDEGEIADQDDPVPSTSKCVRGTRKRKTGWFMNLV